MEQDLHLDPRGGSIERMRAIPFASVRADTLTRVASPITALPSAPQKAIKETEGSLLPGAFTATVDGVGLSSIDKGTEYSETTNIRLAPTRPNDLRRSAGERQYRVRWAGLVILSNRSKE